MDAEHSLQDTVLGQFVNQGVNVNGLIIPGRSIESALARHTFNLIVNNDHEVFKISLVGSATAVRYRDREVLIATQHQLRGIDESQVAMLTDSGSHVITSGGLRHPSLRSDTDATDIVAFDFTEPCAVRPELKRRLFALNERPPDVMNTDVLALLLSGFPSDDQSYDIPENNHIGLARRNVVCLPHSQSSDRALHIVRATRPLDKHPDGMSGGAAFVIQLEGGRPHAYFAGIIVRGGKEIFHIIKAAFVMEFLSVAFA